MRTRHDVKPSTHLGTLKVQELHDELEIYSYQFKQPATVFNKGQVALSGKVGGMKDDLAVLLQLAAYWTGQLFAMRPQID